MSIRRDEFPAGRQATAGIAARKVMSQPSPDHSDPRDLSTAEPITTDRRE
jgi:hypothetical protein